MSKYLMTANWDDAPHLTRRQKDEPWASIPPHQRDARTKGVPQWGRVRSTRCPKTKSPVRRSNCRTIGRGPSGSTSGRLPNCCWTSMVTRHLFTPPCVPTHGGLGDLEGQAVWKAILKAVIELVSKEPDGTVH